MKRFKFMTFFALTALIITSVAAFAIQPVSVTEQKSLNEQTAVQLKKSAGPGGAIFMDKLDVLTQRYTENMRNCVPFHFNQYLDLFGLKIYFNIDINGWIDNKCEYKITGNISAIGNDIREVFDVKIADEQISKIKPVIECHFDKTQLNTMIDAFISHNSQTETTVSKMLESPEKRLKNSKYQLTPEEEKLMLMLMSDNVCQVPNKDEIIQQFTELMQSQENL